MKKLKVFIFEHRYPDRIEKEIKQIIDLFNLECEVSFTEDYKTAKEKISKEKFDIVSLCDLLEIVDENEARRFVTTISALNPNTITFFMLSEPTVDTFKFARANEVNLVFSCGRNFGMPEVIFHQDDIIELKKAMIKSGMVGSMVPSYEIVRPFSIFSQHFIKDTPAEKMAEESCNSIAAKLNVEVVKYAIAIYDTYMEIFVEADKKTEVLKIALSSGLKFWYDYVKKYLL